MKLPKNFLLWTTAIIILGGTTASLASLFPLELQKKPLSHSSFLQQGLDRVRQSSTRFSGKSKLQTGSGANVKKNPKLYDSRTNTKEQTFPVVSSNCKTGTRQCAKSTVEFCISGRWITWEICKQGCGEGQCQKVESCTTGFKRCGTQEENGFAQEVCQNNQWINFGTCEFGCENGRCAEKDTDYNARGFNKKGIHKNETIYDDQGYDKDGYNKNGFNAQGTNKQTQTKYDAQGYDITGFNKNGFNRQGVCQNCQFTKEYNDCISYCKGSSQDLHSQLVCITNTRCSRFLQGKNPCVESLCEQPGEVCTAQLQEYWFRSKSNEKIDESGFLIPSSCACTPKPITNKDNTCSLNPDYRACTAGCTEAGQLGGSDAFVASCINGCKTRHPVCTETKKNTDDPCVPVWTDNEYSGQTAMECARTSENFFYRPGGYGNGIFEKGNVIK